MIRVAPEVVRAFEAGPDGLDIIAVGGPKPEEGDGVRVTAAWPDAKEPLDYSTAPRGTDHRIQSELRESGRLFRRESNRSSPQGRTIERHERIGDGQEDLAAAIAYWTVSG